MPTFRGLPVSDETVAGDCGFRCRLQLRGQWRISTALPVRLARITVSSCQYIRDLSKALEVVPHRSGETPVRT